jgi:hypothetical protein
MNVINIKRLFIGINKSMISVLINIHHSKEQILMTNSKMEKASVEQNAFFKKNARFRRIYA